MDDLSAYCQPRSVLYSSRNDRLRESGVIMSYSYTVTIGRRVGEFHTLSSLRWDQFKVDVQHTLGEFGEGSDQAEYADGCGVWGLVPEEMHKRTLLKDDALTDDQLDDLRRQLSELARLYDQEAIALTIGVSEFC